MWRVGLYRDADLQGGVLQPLECPLLAGYRVAQALQCLAILARVHRLRPRIALSRLALGTMFPSNSSTAHGDHLALKPEPRVKNGMRNWDKSESCVLNFYYF